MNHCLPAAFVMCWGMSVGVALAATPAAKPAPARFAGLWDLDELRKPPAATWGKTTGLCREVYYAGEPRDGKPTRIFAYYAFPPEAKGPVPGMVLVHGGGGTAFAQWATLWAKRGYAAIAMDLGGCGPGRKRLPDGMPGQGHPDKFRPFTTDDEARGLWTYHAVAAVIRGHSLLADQKGVDGRRTGLTGISWGGYLTCIVAGLDGRFRVAVPVYGCGFLHENSCWLGEFKRLGPEGTRRWVRWFDPSRYLPGVRCPILFMNGTNDFAYPLDSYRKSIRAVPGRADVRIAVPMPHGHPQGWAPKEIGLYVDSVLTGGVPLAKLGPLRVAAGQATAEVVAKEPLVKAQLYYTTDKGSWRPRKWTSVAAKLAGATVSAKLPSARPLACLLSVTDGRGAMVSTPHAELP